MLELARAGEVAAMKLLPKRTVDNIPRCISMAPGLNGVFLDTTIAVVTGPWPVVLANAGATVLVTFNAMMLLMPYSRE